MIITTFIKNDIHYIREIWDNGAINIYPNPEFQQPCPEPPKPPLPDLSKTDLKLDFIINELKLKKRFQ